MCLPLGTMDKTLVRDCDISCFVYSLVSFVSCQIQKIPTTLPSSLFNTFIARLSLIFERLLQFHFKYFSNLRYPENLLEQISHVGLRPQVI